MSESQSTLCSPLKSERKVQKFRNQRLQNPRLQNRRLRNSRLRNPRLQNRRLQNWRLQNPRLRNPRLQNRMRRKKMGSCNQCCQISTYQVFGSKKWGHKWSKAWQSVWYSVSEPLYGSLYKSEADKSQQMWTVTKWLKQKMVLVHTSGLGHGLGIGKKLQRGASVSTWRSILSFF